MKFLRRRTSDNEEEEPQRASRFSFRLPSFSMPSFRLPSVKMPSFSMPSFRLPSFRVSEKLGQSLQAALDWLRVVLGWFCIMIGVVFFWLPVPLGIPLMLIGAALIGKRSRQLRLIFYRLRRGIRWLARSNQPVIAPIGQRLLAIEHTISHAYQQHTWQQTRAHRLEATAAPPALPTSEASPPPEQVHQLEQAEQVWQNGQNGQDGQREQGTPENAKTKA